MFSDGEALMQRWNLKLLVGQADLTLINLEIWMSRLHAHLILMTTELLPGVCPVCAETLGDYSRRASLFGQVTTKAASYRSLHSSHNVPGARRFVGP